MNINIKQTLISSAILASIVISSVGHTADLTITDPTPELRFDDDNPAADGFEWQIVGRDDFFGVYDDINNHYVMTIFTSANSENSMAVDTSGDINLADGSVFIDKSSNRLGIGTTFPNLDLHINNSGGSSSIRMQNTSSNWYMLNGDSGLWTYRTTPNLASGVLKLQNDAPSNSIVANATGIGMGTTSPTHALHISQPTKRMLFLDNTAGSSSIRRLLQMTNKGPVGFEMTDRDNPVTWQFRSGSSGAFLINNQGTAGSEVTISKTNGNMIVKGSVTAAGMLLTSSRASKTDISPIKASEVMQKLKKVEIAEWRYKVADKNDRHISPMAEDFYSLFKLGPDNKHINPNDLASVAIIAAKELQKKSEMVSAETAALKAENNSLKVQLKTQSLQLSAKNKSLQERLASLEKLVTNLASGQHLLPEKGDKVVLK